MASGVDGPLVLGDRDAGLREALAVVVLAVVAGVLRNVVLATGATPLVDGPMDALAHARSSVLASVLVTAVGAVYFLTCLHGLARGFGGDGPLWQSVVVTARGFVPWLAVQVLGLLVATLHVAADPFPPVVLGVPLNWLAGSAILLAHLAALAAAALSWYRGLGDVHGLGRVAAGVAVAVPVAPVALFVLAAFGRPLRRTVTALAG